MADAVVVLGGGLHLDGSLTLPSAKRVERAAEIFHTGVAPRIIFSGRCGLAGPIPDISEAAAMAARAEELGIPSAAILLEEQSRDTIGNVYFTREQYLEPNDWHSIRVVTSDFHLSRAAWVFRKILGGTYDFSFVSASSGLSPRELIARTLEECKLTIFLNEWLEALEDADEHAIERLIEHEHPGYASAPTLSHDEMLRRVEEIAHINEIAGTEHWLGGERRAVKRAGRERRR